MNDVNRASTRTTCPYCGVGCGVLAKRTSTGFEVSGDLQLAGRTAPLAFSVRKEGSTFRSAFEINPSKWGIAQYKALLGAIRLKDVVRIELALSES